MLDVVVLNAFFKMGKLFDRKYIPKENGHIKRNINGATKKCLYMKLVLLWFLICQKLGLVGPIEQKIKLPSS